jgi:hypothetical protein
LRKHRTPNRVPARSFSDGDAVRRSAGQPHGGATFMHAGVMQLAALRLRLWNAEAVDLRTRGLSSETLSDARGRRLLLVRLCASRIFPRCLRSAASRRAWLAPRRVRARTICSETTLGSVEIGCLLPMEPKFESNSCSTFVRLHHHLRPRLEEGVLLDMMFILAGRVLLGAARPVGRCTSLEYISRVMLRAGVSGGTRSRPLAWQSDRAAPRPARSRQG